MRRRPGIQGLQRGQQAKAQFKAVGDQASEVRLEQMRAQMAGFKQSLQEFAMKHRSEIRKNPAFRLQFHKMCANCGVDPLQSNKGTFAELLGIGDFYYELGVQIVEACLATRELNGGLMEISALLKYVKRRRGNGATDISEDDIMRSVKKLKVLGSGFEVSSFGTQTMVRSVPVELNKDHNLLLEKAQTRGYVSKAELEQSGWSTERSKAALQHMLKEGLALLDLGAADSVPLYWFPCVSPDAELA